jgi:D-xylose transport system substrate-binding protein
LGLEAEEPLAELMGLVEFRTSAPESNGAINLAALLRSARKPSTIFPGNETANPPMKFRIFLVIASCLTSIVTGLVLPRGGSSVPSVTSRARPLIGLSMDTLKEERWQGDRDLFVARANELGADVLVQSANSDDTRQLSDVQALISRRVDVLVIVPHNGAAMAKAVNIAHDAGIPVIAYDRLITDCDLDLYMTFDNVKVGELQARFLLDRIGTGRQGKIVRIFGAKTDNNALLFKKGQDNVLIPFIKARTIDVVHEDWTQDWKPENAKKIANAAITKAGSAFDAILASNDGTAGGAIQALTEEGLAGRILVTGQDAELSACQRIVNGTQAMTIYKPLTQLARQAAEAGTKMARGKPVFTPGKIDNGRMEVPSILLDVVIVTKENMMETVIKDGFHTAAEVYGSAQPPP